MCRCRLLRHQHQGLYWHQGPRQYTTNKSINMIERDVNACTNARAVRFRVRDGRGAVSGTGGASFRLAAALA